LGPSVSMTEAHVVMGDSAARPFTPAAPDMITAAHYSLKQVVIRV
jgi:hypothetical protein